MKVASLHLYPVKSIAAVDVAEATALRPGFDGDRRFMAVDSNGRFLTQRHHPLLGHLQAERTVHGWSLRGPDGVAIEIGPSKDGAPIDVEVWGDPVRARRVSEAADEMLTRLLGIDARLVYFSKEAERLVGDDPVSFADGYPYLITTTASLVDLNERISGEPLGMASFRPNIVVDGADAWAEDSWDSLQIGDAIFEIKTPCVRCKITTLNPNSPTEQRRDNEPLRTLAKFRRSDGGVIFGVNAVCRTPGAVIRVGDAVATQHG